MKHILTQWTRWGAALTGILILPAAHSQENPDEVLVNDPVPIFDVLDTLVIVGSQEEVKDYAGSVAFISEADIRTQNYTNINRILQRVPGVYVREEDGYGNFPNISIRGADGTRAEKATVMEDGILSAPAPYSAPGAYYSPRAARMSGIEILKGSSQVRYGPHTTGGVINYLSTPVPDHQSFYTRYTYGSDSTQLLHTYYGDAFETNAGNFGYLLEFFGQSSDGYRTIRNYEGHETGFSAYEPMLKVFWEPNSTVYQRFDFKFGYSDMDADETYLGLSEADVRRTPYDRYPASVFDNIDTEHIRTYLRYRIEPTEALSFDTSFYYNRFNRNWYKIDHAGTTMNPAFDGRGQIIGRRSLHTALLPIHPQLGVLQGIDPGAIGVKANNRSYESYGWQGAASLDFTTGALEHTLTAGVRLHEDYEDRFQWIDIYNGDGGGRFEPFRRGVPGEDADRTQSVFATSVYVEDAITLGRLTLRPGARFEHLDMDLNDRGVNTSGDLDTWAAGSGATFRLTDTETLFGGIYRGISTPGPESYLASGIEVEESIGYEAGIRHHRNHLSAELALFLTDYQNLVGTDTGLGLGGGSNLNAGEATVYGVEAITGLDVAARQGLGFNLPAYVSLSWTSAELNNALATGGAEDIYAGGTAGASLPYVPEWKLAAGIGFQYDRFGLNLDATYVDETFGTAQNLFAPLTSSRQGLIDDALVFDLSASYRVTDQFKFLAGIQNLFDEQYLTSRIPEGPRNAAPRTFFIGGELSWDAFVREKIEIKK